MILSTRSNLVLVGLLLVLLVPLAGAEAPPGNVGCGGSSVAVPNDDNDDDDALQVTINGPCHTVPVGRSFSIKIVVATEENGYTIDPLVVEHTHGCTIQASGNQASPSGASLSAWYELLMEDDTCDFVVLAQSHAGSILTPSDTVYAYGAVNVVGFTLQEVGTRADEGLDSFWIPTLLLIAALVGSSLIGLDIVFGFAAVGLVAQFAPGVDISFVKTVAWMLLGLSIEYMLARSNDKKGIGSEEDKP